MKYFIVILVCIVALSCKQKGCTDKASLNYDILAEEDDGSCEYCDSIITEIAFRSHFLKDTFPSSLYYNQNIARFDLRQHQDTFNFKQCGKTACKISLTISNILNENMDIDFTIRGNSPVNFFFHEQVSIPANGTVDMGDISTITNQPCFSFMSSPVTLELENMVVYH